MRVYCNNRLTDAKPLEAMLKLFTEKGALRLQMPEWHGLTQGYGNGNETSYCRRYSYRLSLICVSARFQRKNEEAMSEWTTTRTCTIITHVLFLV